jgi:hypothetical protein
MSAEYRPVYDLPFDLLDGRLEKYGISVDQQGRVTRLIGPHGVLIARPEGNSTHFERSLGVDTEVVLDALAVEYGIEIVDENDLRFWGFSSEAEMIASRAKALSWNDLWILVEGPAVSDARFAIDWLQAALDADRILEQLFEQHPDFRKCIPRREIGFATSALAFMGMWLEGEGVFSISLVRDCRANIFSMMAGLGFFTLTGGRYQLTMPVDLKVEKIVDAMRSLSATEDEEGSFYPHRLLVTMSLPETDNWKEKLTSMKLQERLADRDALLAE